MSMKPHSSVDVFLGTDTQGNPITDSYTFSGDSRYTEKSEDIARRFDWNMMNYQNWWNSPEQQVSRIQEAGLNPLFYLGGQAGTTPAAAGGNQQGHQMSTSSGRLEQILGATKNFADTALSTQKQALDYEIARRQQNLDLQRIGLESRKVAVEEGQLGLNRNRQPYEIRNLEAQTNELASRSRFNEAQIDRLGYENNWTEQQIAESKARMAETNAKIDEIYARIPTYAAQIRKDEATALNQIANANYYDDIRWPTVEKLSAETSRTEEEVQETIARTANFLMDTNKKKMEIKVGEGQSIVLEKQAEGLAIQNALDEKYGGWDRTQRIVLGYVDGACNAVNTVINVKTGGAAAALNTARANSFNNENSDYEEYKSLLGRGRDNLTAAEEDRLDELSERFRNRRSNTHNNPNFSAE